MDRDRMRPASRGGPLAATTQSDAELSNVFKQTGGQIGRLRIAL